MITFNHEKFIEHSVNSILMQKCNFEIELIVANDNSPDKTDLLMNKLLKTHPKAFRINYFKHDQNIGIGANFIFALKQCNGKYIALCDGDDYWTDPLKLQKQVDFLEVNKEYISHSGFANLSNEKNGLIGRISDKGFFDLKDFYTQNNLVTCTVMFRNLIKDYSKSLNKIRFCDWFLYAMLLNISKLKAYTSNEVFSVYRVHAGGIMSNLSRINHFKAHMLQIKYLKRYLNFSINDKTDIHNINNYSRQIFEIELSNKRFLGVLNTIFINFIYVGFKTPIWYYFKSFSKKIKNRIVIF